MRGGDVPVGDGPVVYWMSRDQRAMDNWALCHALAVAREHRRPLHVVFALVPEFANAGARQYCFMLRGLRELESTLGNLGIPFHLATGPDPGVTVPSIAEKLGCSMLVTDFSPLRIGRAWRDSVSTLLCPVDVPVKEVDAHNVVPTWEASDKQEYAARTIRKKINGRLEDFLTDFPTLEDVREAVREAAEDAETSPRAERHRLGRFNRIRERRRLRGSRGYLAEAAAAEDAGGSRRAYRARRRRHLVPSRASGAVRQQERPERPDRALRPLAVPPLRSALGAALRFGGFEAPGGTPGCS